MQIKVYLRFEFQLCHSNKLSVFKHALNWGFSHQNHEIPRTAYEAFFHRNPKPLGLGRQSGQISFWAIEIFFERFISTQFWYCESLVHVFHLSTITSTKNFGLEIIRDSALLCP